ncbi:MAG: type IVB secretion system protein DotA, partial [Tatlockia sp.]|nr:type IVB secretion system protein DotA [Tatlockia sp.]
AVLALGGIVIMYTLIVSTMNTAQEGQMLGQKWSSIWIPLRSTLGLALLIPKASGYCLMQIFVMWIVVQGVGAADKVWNAALGYLNRGGSLVQTQMNPLTSLRSGNSSVASGASVMLQGQVCMVGLQAALQNALQSYQNAKNGGSPSGPCVGNLTPAMSQFCGIGQIPDFLSTVNAVATQDANPNSQSNYSLTMPNFASGPFAALNGICGTISWSPFSASDLSSIQKNISSISPSEVQTVKMTRATAIQQMYTSMAVVAQLMVANNPALNPPRSGSGNNQPATPVAVQQFGVPYLSSGTPCTVPSAQCTGWGRDPASASAPLFSGVEFQGAIANYNNTMMPTLNLVKQAGSKDNSNQKRDFIRQAESQGWLLAGSYFFNLSMLNANATTSSNLTDSGTGLGSSSFDSSQILSTFGSGGCIGGSHANLCEWMRNDPSQLQPIITLINGSTILPSPIPQPKLTDPSMIVGGGHSAIAGIGSSTVNGYIDNAVLVHLPGQAGMTPPSFAMKFNFSLNLGQYNLPYREFPCSGFLCLGGLLGDIFYNWILRFIFNLFLGILGPIINIIIQSLLAYPLVAIASIFQQNVAIIQQPGVNPVVALANMGVNYINFANELWILTIGLAASPFILVIFPLLALILPLLMSWLGIMVAIGFITAYYIPFLPYMIFTFASIAWLMAVIEAMVAAPIVALGVTHPEGHDAFGKGEQAIMIIMNVFLRPSMMIIGFIAAIGLSYVSVWIINAGFANAASFIQGTASGIQWNYSCTNTMSATGSPGCSAPGAPNDFSSMNTGYSGWAGIYGFFFSVLIYTIMYLTVVQKAFTLITYLPDKVLRWIGGQPEGLGEQAAQWAEGEPRKQVEGGGKETGRASAQRDEQLGGYASQGMGKLKDKSSGGGSSVGGTGQK